MYTASATELIVYPERHVQMLSVISTTKCLVPSGKCSAYIAGTDNCDVSGSPCLSKTGSVDGPSATICYYLSHQEYTSWSICDVHIMSCLFGLDPHIVFEPTCAHARWALMRHFPSGCIKTGQSRFLIHTD